MWLFGLLFGALLLGAWTFAVGDAFWAVLRRARSPLTPDHLARSVLTGTGLLMLGFGWLSYAGIIGRAGGPLTLAASLAGVWWVRRRYGPTSRPIACGWLFAAAGAAILLALLPIIADRCFNPYTDALTYMTISEFLQKHSFRYLADPNPYWPLLSQVQLYQRFGLRMGANFLLALLQSLAGSRKAYEVLPLLSAWGVMLNALAVYSGARVLAGCSRRAALCAAILAAGLTDSFHFAALNGQIPQLFGTAFFVFALTEFSRLLRARRSVGRRAFAACCGTGLGFAFLISAYNELLPLLGLLAAALFLHRHLRGNRAVADGVRHGVLAAAFFTLFANIELLRVLKALPLQARAVVGSHIALSWEQHAAMAAGIISHAFYADWWSLLGRAETPALRAALLAYLAVLAGGLWRLARGGRADRLYFIVPSVLLFAGLFCYFRWAVFNPWIPGTRGQTWSMFKLTQWVQPFTVILFAACAGALAPRAWRGRALSACALCALALLPAHRYISNIITAQVKATAMSRRPFEAYRAVVMEVETLAAGRPVEIKIGLDNSKHRQALAYFLSPLPIISDWRNETAIVPYLLPENQNLSLAEPHVVLVPAGQHTASSFILPTGLALQREGPFVEVVIRDDWYQIERAGADSWRWSRGDSSVSLRTPRDAVVALGGRYGCAFAPQKITLSLDGEAIGAIDCADLEMHDLGGRELRLSAGEHLLRFKSDRPPRRIGQDAREFSFLLRNFDLAERTPEAPATQR